MSLTLGSSVLLLVLVLLVVGVFAAWSYHRTTPPISTAMRSILGGLRFASLGLIIFLLFDPMIRRTTTHETEPQLFLLVDNSASVPFVKGESASEQVIAQLQASNSRISAMPAAAFDASPRMIGDAGRLSDSLTFDGSRTNMSAAIDHIRTQARGNVRGAVLISDGLYNTGRNPVFAADDSPVPIHTVVVGDTTRFEDVIMREVVTNEIAYSGVELPVRARIVAEGFEGRNVTVSVSDGANRLASQSLQLRGDGTEQTVDLYVTPDLPGLRRYTVAVSELDGEATHRNNARSVTVQVVDSRRRVLIIGGAPDPDIGAIRQSIERDVEVEVETRIQRSPNAFYEGDMPSDLSDVDLVVLAGFPAPGTPSEFIRSISAGIGQARRPVLYLAGRRLNTEGVRAIGEDILSALPTDGTMTRLEAGARLSAAGRSHPVSGAVSADAAGWANLPPLVRYDAGWRASADAVVLLESTGRAGDGPLLSVRSRGGIRSASILGADSWKWRTLSPALASSESLFDRLIDNLIQWLTSPEDDRLVRVRPTQTLFEGSDPVRLVGEIYDERLVPVEDADVEVEITPDAGAPFRLSMLREGSGRYRLDAGAMPEGTYQYLASARRGDVDLGTDRGTFTVGALESEFMHTRADSPLMRQIAARSGGRSTTLDGLPTLVDALLSDATFTPEREHIVRESSLRRTFALLLLVVALLSAEWVLRKRSGMV